MEELIRSLQKTQFEHAQAALLNPANRTEFEYGKVSGLYQGLNIAIEALKEFDAGKEEEDE